MATYVLLIQHAAPRWVTVGKWGRLALQPGHALYVGSARKGWRARIARHRATEKKVRWHIDYLLTGPLSRVTAVWMTPEDRECLTATALAALTGISQPGKGVGSSDCRCPTHYFTVASPLEGVATLLETMGFAPLPQT
ncbi:MAG: GIY-YIG nuclease family protein [Magnetococcales bacterium]|nr:GIY-YIG nuclease family protein [Magnetococcales bacterium]